MRTVLIFAMLGAGCSEAALSSTSQEILECEPWMCLNSPEAAHHGVRDFDLRGVTLRNDGLALQSEHGRAQIYQNGVAYDLAVDKHGIEGNHPSYPRLEGQALVGAELVVLELDKPLFIIHIDRVREIQHAVLGDELFESYAMTWHEIDKPSTPDQHLCNGPLQLDPNEEGAYAQLLGMLPDESLVFVGDVIDVDLKTMEPDADWNRINIGCAGHTLAKLHLTRNTITSEVKPDWRGRQATFKMLSADYCGTGRPFTVSGEPLVWKGGQLDDFLLAPESLEARWSENGAMCLGVPRLKDTDSPLAAVLFPHIWDQIHSACPRLPECADVTSYQFDGAERVSANPAL